MSDREPTNAELLAAIHAIRASMADMEAELSSAIDAGFDRISTALKSLHDDVRKLTERAP